MHAVWRMYSIVLLATTIEVPLYFNIFGLIFDVAIAYKYF